MADIVCVGAHPDDVEIGMGGTVASLAADGLDVLIVDLTDGEPTPSGSVERRMAEAGRAAEILGCRRLTLGFTNRYLTDDTETRTALAEVLRVERPRMLFVPYPEDAHPDHIAAASIAEAARFFAKLTRTSMQGEPHYPARLYRYMPVHLRSAATPSFLIDISLTLRRKLDAVSSYQSQFGEQTANSGYVETLEAIARYWGTLGRVGAAEPFFAPELPVVRSVVDLL